VPECSESDGEEMIMMRVVVMMMMLMMEMEMEMRAVVEPGNLQSWGRNFVVGKKSLLCEHKNPSNCNIMGNVRHIQHRNWLNRTNNMEFIWN
jgi:hypothetical protein